MGTYLGEVFDCQEVSEFLCLAEGAEVTHYEVLNAMTKGIRNKAAQLTIDELIRKGREEASSQIP